MEGTPVDMLWAAGRDGGPSPLGLFRTTVVRNRIDLARGDGEPVASLQGRWLRTVAIAFASDEKWIAASGYAGGAMIWDTATGGLVAAFPELEADGAENGRLPLLFARGDSLLICGGRTLTIIDTSHWTVARTLDLPSALLHANGDVLRLDAYEADGSGSLTRWTVNLRSHGVEAADRLRQTRVYRMLFDRKAS